MTILIALASACATNPGDNAAADNPQTRAGHSYEPEGPVQAPSDLLQAHANLVGTWVRCSGPTLIDGELAALEFDDDGNFYNVDLDHGVLVKLAGFQEQGTWDVEALSNGIFQWNIRTDPEHNVLGFPVFEGQPRKFSISVSYRDETSVYAIAW